MATAVVMEVAAAAVGRATAEAMSEEVVMAAEDLEVAVVKEAVRGVAREARAAAASSLLQVPEAVAVAVALLAVAATAAAGLGAGVMAAAAAGATLEEEETVTAAVPGAPTAVAMLEVVWRVMAAMAGPEVARVVKAEALGAHASCGRSAHARQSSHSSDSRQLRSERSRRSRQAISTARSS